MPTLLVTGITGNLGAAVADVFIENGYTVIGTSTHPPADGDTKKNRVIRQVDLADEDQVEKFAAWLLSMYGTPDVAVLTAGGFAMGDISVTNRNGITDQFELNFMTTYLLARRIFMQMQEAGRGRLFLTAAAAALDMNKATGKIAYALSKSLVFRLGELLNASSATSKVITTVIAPEIIDTPQNRRAMPGAEFSSWTRPEEIALEVLKQARASQQAIGSLVLQFPRTGV